MKKVTWVILIGIAVLLAGPLSVSAGRTRVSFEANIRMGHPAWGGPIVRGRHFRGGPPARWHHAYPRGGRPFYWGGAVLFGPWYSYGYCAAPPVVVQQQTPVYGPAEEEQTDYWYYCQDPQGYYPYVKDCPGGWMKVVPDVTPPNQ